MCGMEHEKRPASAILVVVRGPLLPARLALGESDHDLACRSVELGDVLERDFLGIRASAGSSTCVPDDLDGRNRLAAGRMSQ